jgi:hypothetical protein
MSAPKTKKEVWGFIGRLNYIAHFISWLKTTYANQSLCWWGRITSGFGIKIVKRLLRRLSNTLLTHLC